MASTDTGGTQALIAADERILLSTAYLPNLDYMALLLSGKKTALEAQEHFTKQTYRNRSMICSANGPLPLSIPLMKQQDKELITHKRISYAERWQNQHWRAITSAYQNSPYFEYFQDELRYFYENEFELLFDYNLQLLRAILKILRVKIDIELTYEYQHTPTGTFDARELIHPKRHALFTHQPYYQVFSGKHGFMPNLCVLDLLFSQGLGAEPYLKQL